MDLVKHKRDMEEHRNHVTRVRNITAFVDTSTPSTLGLKHLATRPKKQQLIDDRHQLVAKENRKLMEKMTKIMSETKPQPKRVIIGSLNEVERKQEVARVNMENKLLMDRLKKTPSVLNRDKMEKDFERHCVVGGQLRRRQMPPVDALVTGNFSMTGKSKSFSSSKSPQQQQLIGGATFDADSYISQHTSQYGGSPMGGLGASTDGLSPVPMRTMSEFRKNVISTKKLSKTNPPGGFSGNNASASFTTFQQALSPSGSVSFMSYPQNSVDNMKHGSLSSADPNARFELSYDPTSSV